MNKDKRENQYGTWEYIWHTERITKISGGDVVIAYVLVSNWVNNRLYQHATMAVVKNERISPLLLTAITDGTSLRLPIAHAIFSGNVVPISYLDADDTAFKEWWEHRP